MGRHVLSNQWCKYLGAQSLTCTGRWRLVLCSVQKCLPACPRTVTSPHAINERSCGSASQMQMVLSVGVVVLCGLKLDFSHSSKFIVASHCCFNFHLSNYIWWWALFICLFAICIFSLVRCLFKPFAQF